MSTTGYCVGSIHFSPLLQDKSNEFPKKNMFFNNCFRLHKVVGADDFANKLFLRLYTYTTELYLKFYPDASDGSLGSDFCLTHQLKCVTTARHYVRTGQSCSDPILSILFFKTSMNPI